MTGEDVGGRVTSDVGPWAMVPVWVLAKKLKPAELVTYVALRSFADRGGDCFPTAKAIAARGNLAVGTVHNAIQGLRSKRLVATAERRRADGSIAGLDYHLTDLDPDPQALVEPRRKASQPSTPTGVDPLTDASGPLTGVDPLHQLVDPSCTSQCRQEHTSDHPTEHSIPPPPTAAPPAPSAVVVEERGEETAPPDTEEQQLLNAAADHALGVRRGQRGWSLTAVRRAMREQLAVGHPAEVVARVMREAADDPGTLVPGRLGYLISTALDRPAGGTPAGRGAAGPPARSVPQCARHQGEPAHNCGRCKAELLGGNDGPVGEDRLPAAAARELARRNAGQAAGWTRSVPRRSAIPRSRSGSEATVGG